MYIRAYITKYHTTPLITTPVTTTHDTTLLITMPVTTKHHTAPLITMPVTTTHHTTTKDSIKVHVSLSKLSHLSSGFRNILCI